MLNCVSFKGIIPPYTNKQGYHITPIAKNPTTSDIYRAILATKLKKEHSGLNGRAFFYGEDLVVKKYMDKSEACNYDPQREIKALDLMFDKGILLENSQRGEFAFTTPNNTTYLVSTKVSGAEANPINNRYNKQNLSKLIKLIGKLDRPIRYPVQKEEEHKDYPWKLPIIFPYQVSMHYDLSPGNFNINENDAGIFDFEYLRFCDLNPPYVFMNQEEIHQTISDLSDIPGIISNLRTFEYRSLLEYLENTSSEDAYKTFVEYLEVKSQYHQERADFYQSELNKVESIELTRELEQLLKKEIAHAQCLAHPTKEIIKAEAMKIQIASYIYKQGPAASSNEKINLEQIKEYILQAKSFFEEQEKTAYGYEKTYFEDCKRIMESWKNLPSLMDWQEAEITIDNFIPPWKKITEISEEELDNANKNFQNQLKNQKLFKSKKTDEKITTLDEHLGI